LLFAKSEVACAELCRQFRERTVKKTYYAEVAGHVSPMLSTISAPLTAGKERPLQVVDAINGKDSKTNVKILGVRSSVVSDFSLGSTLVELSPITGRTHQLRVHMGHCGHHVLGDTLYYTPETLSASSYLRLHAANLSFKHPNTGTSIVVESSSCKFL
jgi:tRNA pseudouridine32 synthase / 23S rRNA pseudouridine746 synthase